MWYNPCQDSTDTFYRKKKKSKHCCNLHEPQNILKIFTNFEKGKLEVSWFLISNFNTWFKTTKIKALYQWKKTDILKIKLWINSQLIFGKKKKYIMEKRQIFPQMLMGKWIAREKRVNLVSHLASQNQHKIDWTYSKISNLTIIEKKSIYDPDLSSDSTSVTLKYRHQNKNKNKKVILQLTRKYWCNKASEERKNSLQHDIKYFKQNVGC